MKLHSRRLGVAAAAVAVIVHPGASLSLQQNEAPYRNVALPVEKRVDDLLARMTLDEKIGQMTQADHASLKDGTEVDTLFLGSVLSGGDSELPDVSATAWRAHTETLQKRALGTRLGIPLIYGIDAVHGHANVRGAVVFPHNIGMGCTRNPKLVEQASAITAREVTGTGMHWNFAPCIAVPQDDRWGRTYEGFGETAELAETLGSAAVRGLQGTDVSGPGRVLATAKHFVGDGGTRNGVDRGDTVVDEATLRRLHLAGYAAAIKAGVGSIMVSYSSWNGEKMHGNRRLITDVLKGELGFTGIVVSDWNGIDELPGTETERIASAVNAGIDMMMVPDKYREFIAGVKANVESGRIPPARIDDAVRRILTTKFRMGLFERPFGDPSELQKIGSAEHRAVARQAVRESQVLLINRGDALPLSPAVSSILVAGRGADDLGMQCGGWTISWQGSMGRPTDGTTVLEAIKKVAPRASIVIPGNGESTRRADVAVVVIGEAPYAEMKGDRSDLALDPADVAAVKQAKKSASRVIVVLFSGRPLILEPILDDVDALVAAWLPGTEGDGIADVLFGRYNPTGKLSVTWPRSMAQQPINVGPNGEKPPDALFDYGFGLSYPTAARGPAPPVGPTFSPTSPVGPTFSPTSSVGPTFRSGVQERRGYPADARLLIIHADDLGMSHSVNRATFEALENNWITSASILVPCPWFPEVARWARAHPDADLGVHLALNSEWTGFRWGPVGPPEASLLDRDGYLPLLETDVVARARPTDIDRELRAQVDRARDAGVSLTHLDSHMATLFRTAEFFDVYRKLGTTYGLPVLMERLGDRGGEQSAWAVEAQADALIDRVISISPGVSKDDWPQAYEKMLAPLPPGVYQLIVHLAYDDEEMRGATSDHPDWGAAWRQNDLDLVRSSRFRDFLHDQRFVLVGWKDLVERRR